MVAHLQELHEVCIRSVVEKSPDSEKHSEIALLISQQRELADRLNKLTRDNEGAQLRIEEKDRQIATLTSSRQQQADLLSKLAYTNEELHAQIRELLASRWRKLGRRLRLAKAASFED
jgi:hypothetical protein